MPSILIVGKQFRPLKVLQKLLALLFDCSINHAFALVSGSDVVILENHSGKSRKSFDILALYKSDYYYYYYYYYYIASSIGSAVCPL